MGRMEVGRGTHMAAVEAAGAAEVGWTEGAAAAEEQMEVGRGTHMAAAAAAAAAEAAGDAGAEAAAGSIEAAGAEAGSIEAAGAEAGSIEAAGAGGHHRRRRHRAYTPRKIDTLRTPSYMYRFFFTNRHGLQEQRARPGQLIVRQLASFCLCRALELHTRWQRRETRILRESCRTWAKAARALGSIA